MASALGSAWTRSEALRRSMAWNWRCTVRCTTSTVFTRSSGFDRDPSMDAPLFMQPWWLDAVAPGQWAEAVVASDGRVIARLPYLTRSQLGLRLLGTPPLTQFLGPWFDLPDGKYETRLKRQH